MSTSSSEITAYTPLETLLLFHNLSTHGTHRSSFSLISNILVRNPLVKDGETFDRGRLAPDALREFYHLQLKEAESEFGNGDGQVNGDGGRQGSPAATRKKKAKTPPTALSNPDKTGLIKILTSRLYEQYRSTIFLQIREDERKYAQLERDIEDISAGLWDERLLQEKATRTRSRSSSTTPRSSKERIISSPSLDRRNTTTSVSPIVEQGDEPLLSNVSVEVSPRALPATRTPTPQYAIAQSPTTPVTPQLQPSVSFRLNNPPVKLEQSNIPLRNVPERHPRNVPVPAPIQQSPPPHTREQAQEGLREAYTSAHPQAKREVIKAALGQTTSPKNQTTAPWSSQAIPPSSSSSPRQTQTHRALAAPIPSPQVPPKMEAIPPPPPSSTSSPVAPPLSRPLGVKIEAPVPPPTRTPFPPITPRPVQATYPQSQTPLSRTPTTPAPAQTQPPGHQGLSGLHQLADVADTRRQQQHTPSYAPHGAPIHPHLAYSPGQPSPYGPAPISAHVQVTQQGHRTPTPSTPGGGNFGILFPAPAPTTPIPSVQQYPTQFSPQNQARQINVQQQNFQHYTPHVPTQQQSFEQVSPVPSPPVQRIAPRPPPTPITSLQQPQHISPTKSRPPPINTSTPSIETSPLPQSPGHKGEPGSPIPPRPDEISPISTPSRSPPPPESPKPLSTEKSRGKKRLFQEDENSPQDKEKINGSREDTKQQARTDRGREDKPATKRQKSMKYDKTPAKNTPARGSSKVEKETDNSLVAPESKVKDEEVEAIEMESDTPASIEEQKPEEKPRGRGRPPRKPKPQPEEQEHQIEPAKDKRSKRKRAEINAPTPQTVDDDDDDSEVDVASVSPTPQRRHMPKLESQNSNAMSMPSPSPFTAPIGPQPLVVATKKFLQLSAPLLGDISSHKFANLFSNAVNERMAPGYRSLVSRPQDLKSIKAAVKSGTAAITNTSTGTPAMTPTTDFAAATPPASSSTFATLPATTLNTPPKGIVNSVQLEKELFRMFANAIMYNKSTTEIAKETVMMARDVEGMVDNFRTAEEAGMKKALGAAATGSGFGSARKGGARDRERENTIGTVAGEEEQSISGEKGDDGDGEDSVMGDTDGASERGKGKGIAKRKRLKR